MMMMMMPSFHPKLFYVPSLVMPLGVIKNWAENSASKGKLFTVLSYIELKPPNSAELCRLRTVNFVRILQGNRPLWAIILLKFQIFKVL